MHVIHYTRPALSRSYGRHFPRVPLAMHVVALPCGTSADVVGLVNAAGRIAYVRFTGGNTLGVAATVSRSLSPYGVRPSQAMLRAWVFGQLSPRQCIHWGYRCGG